MIISHATEVVFQEYNYTLEVVNL